MKQALQIRFLGMEPSPAVEAAARAKAAKLEQFRPDLMACRVCVVLMDKHRRQGRHFSVRIDLTVPGNELVVDQVHDVVLGSWVAECRVADFGRHGARIPDLR